MTTMNLDDLRFFLALARSKTMSGAGKKLGVKHTTVTRRVAALEAQLGSRLFDRLPDGYFLTQSGENLYVHAVKIEEQAIDAQRDILGHDAQLQGPLKLTAPFDFFCNIIAPRLGEFTTAYPDIDLQLMCSRALFDLGTLEADIAIRITEAPPENLIGRLVSPLVHGVYASEKYLQTEREADQLILWSGEKQRPKWAKDHFPVSDVLIRTDEALTMLAMVQNHMGIARMACYIAETDPSLRRLDLKLAPSTWGIWVLSHSDLRSTARVRVCKDFLIGLIKQSDDLIAGTSSSYFL